MRHPLLAALVAAIAIAPGQAAKDRPAMTAPAADPMFTQPYIDLDEWRDVPVRHRYVHGGFEGTDLRFSFYLPPKDRYRGRFFQYVTPVPDSETLAQAPGDDKIGFAIDSGGYFVETNGGGSAATAGPAFRADPTIGAYRANAAAAEYSRQVALAMYGGKRPYGYLYGGSGGGFRTLGSMEHTATWDGAVPFVLGSPMAAPNVFAVRMHAMRLLRGKFPQIVDAMDAGGSGDPYAGLNAEQAAALGEVTAMGFPPTSWFGWQTMGVHGFTALYQGMLAADPGYFADFWTKPGYLGFDRPESFAGDRLRFETTIAAVLSEDQAVARGLTDVRIPGSSRGTAELAWQRTINDGSLRPVAFALTAPPPDVGFIGGDLHVLSGAAKGARLALRALRGDLVTLGVVDLETLAKLRPGDAVRVDNSNFLAAQTYHRHQVPDRSFYVWDQFRKPDGAPRYPQRAIQLGPMFAAGAAGTVPTGRFNGKVIVVESLLDREAFPWQADWYATRFRANGLGDRFRLQFVENALHGASEWKAAPTRVIDYTPVLQQALRDVAAWVEKGTPPPASTAYRIENGQVVVPVSAKQRHGIQPTVRLTANGGARAVVKVGQPVAFAATLETPPGAGRIVAAEWDFDGSGQFAGKAAVKPSARVSLAARHAFATPGTHFVTLRTFSQRTGDTRTPYARIPNLARVRVVVE